MLRKLKCNRLKLCGLQSACPDVILTIARRADSIMSRKPFLNQRDSEPTTLDTNLSSRCEAGIRFGQVFE